MGTVKRDFLDGRVYHGIDELNMSCLAWLDSFGNGQVNERTKKIPRDMFVNEYLKLQHVYERKNDDVRYLRRIRMSSSSNGTGMKFRQTKSMKTIGSEQKSTAGRFSSITH